VTNPCRHHWIIESPNGPTSRGRCRLCGDERDFTNWMPKTENRLSPAERAAVARAKREEAIIANLIHNLGGDECLPE